MKLFVFDHCPFCIKAMMVAGLKKVDVELVYLQNHDVEARVEKVGANLVPILETPDGSYMAESLDIAAYFDNVDGQPIVAAGRQSDRISSWMEVAGYFGSHLIYPRWMMIDLPEFQSEEANAWFIKNKSAMIGMTFDEAFANSEEYLAKLNVELFKLDWLVPPSQRHNQLTYDDVNLFPFLRNYTVIKGLRYPGHVRQYLDEMSVLTGIALYDSVAV
ncbi:MULTISPECIES: glutaredoxin 2 [Enterovibrio]|uniref:Glutaredoxin, GrxB family n=1 Tax=Enterovibrio norvegicus FF-454 TaxID=1185651 RepID=A0A1E5C3J4_9GAMM|nr:glutaredoxin 2 [Enterovibrio norvegicus]OEE60071.1 glutaredoxin, GrxB family [Enterovibrio norvegicus FF-454]OEE89803.1 glutaredoxin, GrxB family [Enterovibrio norvegicus FF-162]